MENNIILSLCISTYYDRGDILNRTIKSIVSDPAFDERVELVIIDNGSKDNTAEICHRYMTKYKNVRYYKNDNNIGNRNFTKVLKEGKGRYVKFLNDTQTFMPGKLGLIIQYIIQYSGSGNNLLFIRKTNKKIIKDLKVVLCENKDEVLSTLSYYTTWSGNFGSYLDYFCELDDPNRAADLKFPQVDWIYSLTEKRPTILIFDDFYDVETTYKKGNWNFINVFTTYYFSTLKIHFKRNLIFEREKWRVFKYHLVPFYYQLSLKDNLFEYNNSDAKRVLFKYYWYNIAAYIFVIIYFIYHKLKE